MTVITTTNAERQAEAAEHRLRADERRWPREIQPAVRRPAPVTPRLSDPRGTWSAAR
jgi:hypothetical protein